MVKVRNQFSDKRSDKYGIEIGILNSFFHVIFEANEIIWKFVHNLELCLFSD